MGDLKQQIQEQQVAITSYKEKISVSMVDRILFDSGKAKINREGRKVLQTVGQALKNLNKQYIRVIGHTDDVRIAEEWRFRFPSNWELSASRAAAVSRYFVKNEMVNPANIEAVGRSYYDPIEQNDTPEGRAKNRRVEIVITGFK